MDDRAAVTTEWKDLIEVLHALGNIITVRSHYSPGHPAIAQADQQVWSGLSKLSERIPELIVALVDDEFVICERPLPDLRARLHVLADAMKRHEIECIVFQRGITPSECTALGQALALPADQAGVVRERVQQQLLHVLLRFIALKDEAKKGLGSHVAYFVPVVQGLLVDLANALASDGPVDRLGILAVANQILVACGARGVGTTQRAWSRTMEDEAAHATNVAVMTAAMTLEAGYPNRVCVDATAAALVHDVGHLLLPAEIRGIPEPLLDERAVPVFRNHTFAGASMLLGAGCSPLWVATALEHHRGVDGEGYPALDSKAAPHELVRIVSIANFFDRKRTLLYGRGSTPEDALLQIRALEERYFGKGMLKRFMRALGVFPPGTTVELSNREPAVVTRSNVVDTWRPQVRILRGPAAGKHVELRAMSASESRHELSIVRSILPPLLRPEDVVAPILELEAVAAPEPIRAPLPKTGPTTAEVARAELGGMEAMLDALLTVSSDALTAPPPLIQSSVPPAYVPSVRPQYVPAAQPTSAPPSPLVPAPPMAAMPPGTVSRPPTAPWSQPPLAPPVPPAPMPARAPVQVPASMPPAGAPKLPSHMPARAPSRPPPEELVPAPPPPRALPSHMPGPKPARRPTLTKEGVPYVLVKEPAGLDPFVAFLFSLVDGETNLAGIIDASGMPQEDVVKIVLDLVNKGVIAVR
ncbi:MAG: HD domain-containing protein [Deltaproteobacteria bacterium]|nr:HD domain-containing protein [Deltaproteobacteria bacterium]